MTARGAVERGNSTVREKRGTTRHRAPLNTESRIIVRPPSERPSTWFVTGTSRGLGLELAAQLLRRGDGANLDVTARTAATTDHLAA
ncbi:hypothetical protein GCM10023403_28300 [Pseudonocardia benzenivorans]|nr:hypothetical protein PSD17_37490 [Pseudonocardia sp. D17]